MKHFLRIFVISLCVIFSTSCTKEDDADAFVGRYSVSDIENETYAGMTHTSSISGTMNITKVSANRIQTSGWIDTFGEVVGNAVYLESISGTNSNGSLTIAFSNGYLNGNVLTFSSTTSGSIQINGNWYSYSSLGQHTCIKQP